MGNDNLEKNSKCTTQKLDEKSLEVLKLIDDCIQQQYSDYVGDEFLSEADNKAKSQQKSAKFSEAYQTKKQLLLEGRVAEVQREIDKNKRKRKARRWSKIVAAVVILILCGIALIGLKRI